MAARGRRRSGGRPTICPARLGLSPCGRAFGGEGPTGKTRGYRRAPKMKTFRRGRSGASTAAAARMPRRWLSRSSEFSAAIGRRAATAAESRPVEMVPADEPGTAPLVSGDRLRLLHELPGVSEFLSLRGLRPGRGGPDRGRVARRLSRRLSGVRPGVSCRGDSVSRPSRPGDCRRRSVRSTTAGRGDDLDRLVNELDRSDL